jgi:hypothetical protein
MDPVRKCIHCGEPAVGVDMDYNEAYCQKHYDEQEATNEPIGLAWAPLDEDNNV